MATRASIPYDMTHRHVASQPVLPRPQARAALASQEQHLGMMTHVDSAHSTPLQEIWERYLNLQSALLGPEELVLMQQWGFGRANNGVLDVGCGNGTMLSAGHVRDFAGKNQALSDAICHVMMSVDSVPSAPAGHPSDPGTAGALLCALPRSYAMLDAGDANRRPKQILVVVDVAFNQDLQMQLLEKDYDVLPASDGAAGLQMAEQERPDLILMDFSLPVLDGWEATHA